MTDFKMIPLSEIHPDKNQPRKFFDDHSLQDLTESVKSKGVLQPIMVRPNGNGYILVCGERRFKASAAAELKEVPAVIRNLTNEEALEIQFIENIQRADVHPMDEAITFKQMLENKVHPYSIADIAAKINKPESYVSHRLVLNHLIEPLQKEFWAGKFLIGQAVMIARLTAEDQAKVNKDARNWRTKQITSVPELREWIDTNITHVLSKAPFKKDDPTLNPEMGACTGCPFRSGNNPSLFDDIKETDRCFKPSCFKIKCNNSFIRTVTEIIEKKPEIHLIHTNSGYEILPEIQKLIKDNGIKVLKDHTDFFTYKYDNNIKARGFYLTGYQQGKFETIYLKGKHIEEAAKNGQPVTSFDMDIAGIKQRTERAAELDDEKVWLRIHKEVVNNSSDNGLRVNTQLTSDASLSTIDTAALLMAMYEKASNSTGISKLFGIKSGFYLGRDERKNLLQKFKSATPEQFNAAARIFFVSVLDSPVGSHTVNTNQGVLKEVAEQYFKKEIDAIEAEQKEKRDKREARAAVRIKALKESKKQADAAKAERKKSTGKANQEKKKTEAKKAAKKGKGIKALLQ